MFDFQNLEVYKKAKSFHVGCKRVMGEKKLDGYVSNQTARASVFECIAILDILQDEDKISNSEFDTLASRADELSRILFAMIKNLK